MQDRDLPIDSSKEKTVNSANEESQRLFDLSSRIFIDHASDAMFVYDNVGVILDVNRKACELLGYSQQELIGKTPALFLAKFSQKSFDNIVEQLNDGQNVSYDTVYRSKNGKTLPVDVRLCPFVMDGRRLAMSIARDISERKLVEADLLASEKLFRDLADAIPQIVWTAVPDGSLEHLNHRASEFTGVNPTELKGWAWTHLVHPDDLAKILPIWGQVLKSGEPQVVEFRIRRFDGEYHWHICHQAASRNGDGTVARWFGACADIQNLKLIEEELNSNRQRLEVLSRQLIKTQESERHKIALELHDEIGQQLTAIKMGLNQIRRQTESVASSLIENTVAIVDQTIVRVRSLSLSLRPPQLDELGLVAALHWLLKLQAGIGDIEWQLETNLETIELPGEIAIVCFRFVQEALTNSLRHARCTLFKVTLRIENSELYLTIFDDGIGFDVEAARKQSNFGSSLGLLGMQERVHLVNGRLSIESGVGRGTKIECWIPLPN